MRQLSLKYSPLTSVLVFFILIGWNLNGDAQTRISDVRSSKVQDVQLPLQTSSSQKQELLYRGDSTQFFGGADSSRRLPTVGETVAEIPEGKKGNQSSNEPTEKYRKKITFKSSIDGSIQEAFTIIPPNIVPDETYLVVSLHSWSSDLNQRSDLESLVFGRGWCYLFPNFRGPNQHPDACGSKIAQQDILDALEQTLNQHGLSSSRVFLTGTSGGGHMTMLMAGLYPERWRAACAWVGISDLVAWHQTHRGKRYGNMIEKSCGGAPDQSPATEREYHDRSPINFISGASALPIALFTGIHDGHRGSVPVRQSIDAFNVICTHNGDPVVSELEIQQLSVENGRLNQPREGDEGYSESLRRKYYLKRSSKDAQLLIFEGGHEGISSGTIDWFEKSVE